jgi:hypothetical protein
MSFYNKKIYSERVQKIKRSMSKFEKALAGVTLSRGGLNKEGLRNAILRRYPKQRAEIKTLKTRQDLVDWYTSRGKKKSGSSPKTKRSTPKTKRASPKTKRVSPKSPKVKSRAYIIRGSPLTEKQKKYCRCLAHVSAQNKAVCYRSGEWKKGPKSKKGCLNPYSICTKLTKRSGPRFECVPYYNLDAIPAAEIKGMAGLHGKTVTQFKKYIRDRQKEM